MGCDFPIGEDVFLWVVASVNRRRQLTCVTGIRAVKQKADKAGQQRIGSAKGRDGWTTTWLGKSVPVQEWKINSTGETVGELIALCAGNGGVDRTWIPLRKLQPYDLRNLLFARRHGREGVAGEEEGAIDMGRRGKGSCEGETTGASTAGNLGSLGRRRAVDLSG